MGKKMTVAQGMKEMKLIDQKAEKRIQYVRALCARPSDQKPIFEKQTEKVASLRQSVQDLVARKCRIRAAIQKSNLETNVEWKGKTYSLQEILFLKQEGAGTLRKLLLSLDSTQAERMVEAKKGRDQNSSVELVLHFDPADRERALEVHMDLMGNLDVLIDGSNHRTEIDVDMYVGDEFDSEDKG